MDTMLAFGLEDTADMMSGFDQEGTVDMMLGLCHAGTDCFVLKQLIKRLNSNLEKNGHLIMHETFCELNFDAHKSHGGPSTAQFQSRFFLTFFT